MSPIIAEFIGTFILILLGNGVVANVVLNKTKGAASGWIVITTGWALAVYVGVVVAGPYSGAHLNPAVTLGLALGGKFAWSSVFGYIVAQLLGAMLGALFVWLMYKEHFIVTDSPVMKKASFYTYPEIKNFRLNFLSELLGTFILVFGVFYITNGEMEPDHTPIGLGSIGAIPVAFIVWSIGLSLGGTTGYAINPIRDFGPRLVYNLLPIKDKNENKADWQYAWVPILGPLAGAAVAAFLFLALSHIIW